MNVLLDGFPEDYMGYKINTDFRVGILLTKLSEDKRFDDDLKLIKSLDLLYKEKVPDDLSIAVSGLLWFLSCGKSEEYYLERDDVSDNTKCIDFDFDSLDIWGAFWQRGIDLSVVNMHWFKFMSAISNLGDCPLTNKISYRAMDLKGLKGDTKKYYADLKNKYRIKTKLTKEEYEEYVLSKKEEYGSYYAKLRGMR